MTPSGPSRRTDRVRLPGRPTDVQVGEGVAAGLAEEVRQRFPRARRVGLVVDEGVARAWPDPDLGSDRAVLRLAVPGGEVAKDRVVLAHLQDGLLDLTRDEPVVAWGGGAVLDVAGFAAATVRRGLPWVAVPTTVVGMADAAVGGKVAVNHARGKNLLGTFHPPALVLADPLWIATLGPRDRVAGLAEVYKAGVVADPHLVTALRGGAPTAPSGWTDLLARAIAVKARIVEADERDEGVRRSLNYGHTVGHALERVLGGDALRHGEAVAIGMAAAARLARARGLVDEAWVAQQDRDLLGLGLPVRAPAGVAEAPLLATLGVDKKRRPGARHVFVLPRPAGGVEVREDVTDDEVRAAIPWATT